MTIRQQLHNLVWGENNRQENRRWHYGTMTHDEWFAMVAQGVLTMPDQSRTWGIDISGRWDGVVDLAVTRERGGDFVFIKGLDGTVRTRLYAENRANAIRAGLLHGPYFWLYPDNKVPCRAQATEGTRFMQEFPSDLPAMMDFEWTRYAGEYANPSYADLDKWATEYLALGNRKPLLYSAAGYMNPLGRIPESIKAKFAGLVIANYGVINPTLPYGYLGWDFWQASASGDAIRLAPNNNGKLEVDIDYWRGDLVSLYAFAGTQQEPPAEEPTMAKNKVTITWDQGARERQRARVSTLDTYGETLPDNSVHYSDFDPVPDIDYPNDPNKRWIQLQSGWYIATRYPSASGAVERAVVEPVQSEPVPVPNQPAAVPFRIELGDDVTYVKQVITGTLQPK
jgi:GH25 family lysozyme M1 (1,4-beta-N-acetylmuramidase)